MIPLPTPDKFKTLAALVALVFAAGCGGGSGSGGGGGGGGGGGSTPAGCVKSSDQAVAANMSVNKSVTPLGAQNVAPLTVDGGPKNNYVNGVFTTVTVCLPGSTGSCQTIDHVLVDTGSYGLRLLTTTGGGQLNLGSLNLPPETDTAGAIAECAQFSDGVTWGAVRMADVYIGGPTANNMLGEKALNIPVQVIADSSVGSPPSACTAFGTPEDNISGLLANGIVGIGPFQQDCGGDCVTDSTTIGLYYHCSSGNCQETTISLTKQVINPIAAFSATASGPTDNNGSIMQLPAVPLAGATLVNGALVFGIGTESNNGLAGATVYTASSGGDITTVFAQRTLGNSFIDSGSNGYFFLDSSTSGFTACLDSSNAPGFYCYPNNLTCSAVNQGANGAKGTVTFGIADANTLVQNGNAAYNNLAGPNTPAPNPSGSVQTGFDWGLTFFYGRSVFTGIEGVPDSHGNPQVPFYAY